MQIPQLDTIYIFPDEECSIIVNGQDTPGKEDELEDGAAGGERHGDLVQEQLSQEDERENQPVAEGGQTIAGAFSET